MIDVTVVRGAGDVLGEDVSSVLITATVVATEKGREIIERNTKVRLMNLSCLYTAGLKPGVIVQVMDALQGVTWRGKIVGVDIGLDGVSMLATLRIERPI